ncbi:hypothetical protein [Rhodopirellula bahusiensis]|uniref:Lipoprotein n=1 Tax=Rhodopirellula bahusiensis TaxID=2014065 RepID=A0A2G1W7A8_9BACT|nr:hypothetical protein [Rhodopirellula bahusiensis]PHQ34891.1 hypothetical protein CEE69_13595 [Rhodopirellula bahusiensis]
MRFFVLLIVVTVGGCVQSQYRYGVQNSSGSKCASPSCNRVAVGGDHPVVDRIEKVVQSPRRTMRKFLGKDEPTLVEIIQQRSEAFGLAQGYLAINGLDDVYVDVRRYEPGEHWERLKANDRISGFWKYTAGTLDIVGYSLLPGRAFHSDHYSPFTNTLSLNSTDSLDSLYESGLAKQFRKQRLLGTYAVAQRLPFFPLLHHTQTTSDLLTYAREMNDWDLEEELYPATYSQIGQAAVSEAIVVLPAVADEPFYVGGLIGMAGGVVGSVTGNSVAIRECKKLEIAPSAMNAGDKMIENP